MSAQHTPETLRDFSRKHAPALAQSMTSLCGKVIAKGLQGIIEEVCRLQQERDELLDALRDLEAMAERYRQPGYPVPDAQKKARAVIAKATSQEGAAS